MSTANRLTDMQKDLDLILSQLAQEVGGCQEAIKMLAVGLDELVGRMDRFEKAAAKAAGVVDNGE